MIGFSITSPTRSLTELWERAYYDIAPRLYRLPGRRRGAHRGRPRRPSTTCSSIPESSTATACP